MALGLGLGLGLLMGLWMEQLTSSAKSVLHCAKQFPHLITLIMQPRSESRCQSPVSLKFSPSSVFFLTFALALNLICPQIVRERGPTSTHLPSERVIVAECFFCAVTTFNTFMLCQCAETNKQMATIGQQTWCCQHFSACCKYRKIIAAEEQCTEYPTSTQKIIKQNPLTHNFLLCWTQSRIRSARSVFSLLSLSQHTAAGMYKKQKTQLRAILRQSAFRHPLKRPRNHHPEDHPLPILAPWRSTYAWNIVQTTSATIATSSHCSQQLSAVQWGAKNKSTS